MCWSTADKKKTTPKKRLYGGEWENISDEVRRLLDRPVRLDVWASYLQGPNALSKTLRQHVNMSYCEHMRNKTGRCQCLRVMPVKSLTPVACGAGGGGGDCETMTTEMWWLKVRFSGKWQTVRGSGPRIAIAAQQSQALSTSLCNITSMNLKVEALISFIYEFLCRVGVSKARRHVNRWADAVKAKNRILP